jgi:hypothetical protein
MTKDPNTQIPKEDRRPKSEEIASLPTVDLGEDQVKFFGFLPQGFGRFSQGGNGFGHHLQGTGVSSASDVEQVSKPAVSRISKSAGRRLPFRPLICATVRWFKATPSRFGSLRYDGAAGSNTFGKPRHSRLYSHHLDSWVLRHFYAVHQN